MSKLLIEDKPLQLLPQLAVCIGVNEALVLQQLHFLLLGSGNGRTHSGTRYIYNTYDQWRRDHFPFLSIPTLKRTFIKVEKLRLIKSTQPEGRTSRRKWYTIDHKEVEKLEHRSRSYRADQLDLNGKDQIDPLLKEQRIRQNKPPTPGKDSGGFDALPGEQNQTSRRSGKPGTSSTSWVAQASRDPAAVEFLALAGMDGFPDEGRQSLARKFVQLASNGQLGLAAVRLVSAMRDAVAIPNDPTRLLQNFGVLASEAREVAQLRLDEMKTNARPQNSSSIELLQELKSAEGQVKTNTPDELFGSGVPLLMPYWVAMTLFVRCGAPGWERWRDSLGPKILREINCDAGIRPFLKQIKLPIEEMGFSEQMINDERRAFEELVESDRSVLT